MDKFKPTEEQKQILSNDKKTLIVSASAGSGKTSVLVEYVSRLISGRQRVPIKRLLVLTFTNVAADEMKQRLLTALNNRRPTNFLLDQIDDLPTSDICTIDSFCEKIIKKNLDKLEIEQNFSVLDEGQSIRVKKAAFEDAFAQMIGLSAQDFWDIFNAFSRNKNSIFECMQYIESFMDCCADAKGLTDKILSGQQDFFNLACKIVEDDFNDELDEIEKNLKLLQSQDLSGQFANYFSSLFEIISMFKGNDLQTMTNIDIDIPLVPRSSQDREYAAEISLLRGELKKCLDGVKGYMFDEKHLHEQIAGRLSKALMQLYLLYKEQYSQRKVTENLLDFADIETYAALLLENKDVADGLQSAYDYVFVDEYQDTNKLQEKIIKKIAQSGRFIAVGDSKQSIYGFRNATMQIMNDDIAQSMSSSDGKTVFLRGNFRSDCKILNFVNHVFSPIMKGESCGIDYKSTSMLEGLAPYPQSDESAVSVYFVSNQTPEKDEKNQIYSVKDAPLVEKDTSRLEAQTIVKAIDDMVVSKIFDLKAKKWRSVELNDIVVLLRGSGPLMYALENELALGGYPFVSEDKQTIAEDGDIQVLQNFLKLCLSQNSENALASVLMSFIGKMSADEISQIACLEGKDLTEKLLSSKNTKVADLMALVQQFKADVEIFGLQQAFERLFDKTDFYAYLKNLGKEKENIVDRFLKLTVESNCNYQIAGFLSYMDSLGKQKFNVGQATNAIRIMTIHGSKGQEYPIVILGGCGNPIISPNRKPYLITEKLGLSVMGYDNESLLKYKTPQFEASKILKRKSEYVDELMIFYVALTRAKNKLVLTGQYNFDKFKQKTDMFHAKSYFDWLLMSHDDTFVQNLVQNGKIEHDAAQYFIVDQIDDLQKAEKANVFCDADEKLVKKIQDYLNFSYKNIDLSKISLKNSVTGLLKLQIDDKEQDYAAEQKTGIGKFSASQVGTIYHTALKEIDFNSVQSMADLQSALKDLVEKAYMSQDEVDILDRELLLKDIILLKNLTKNKKIYKEQPFIMKLPLSQILGSDSPDRVLVQGVVDMFALGEENILVDYKFTSTKNREKLIERYGEQLVLYSKAIENAFGVNLSKKYIFSIKNGDLIEIL